MSDNTERPADGAAPRDPWAPPDTRVPLDKNTGDPRPQPDADQGNPGPPPVHDQQTVTSMPGVGTGPVPTAGFGAPDQGQHGAGDWHGSGSVPPPPVGPNGPGQATPPPMGQYGYPAQAPPAQYGYPAPGQPPQYGDYAGYPGYGQSAWGGPGPANGMGIASLVLGIISVALFCMYGLGVILGVLALIFGLIGRGRVKRGEANNSGVALAGVILGSIGIAISAAFLGFIIWAITTDEFDDDTSVYEPASLSLVVEGAHAHP
ncbi:MULTISPECIES: DUF4190 domain-containing protein [unclassified Streptomyces]|uniref:DUF4190 domain-containing protein n=1 Tax=unclassified Streptomyces TaxID=2593676 RepID=UPI00225414B6|nr:MULTISPECIES: DUF4190 domain-containing protein [unclassified Streptomyces]MCX5143264.1 DUF4190 domain-containing protein [Streptomyces sp. NBC_00338]WRZ67685.1 DUF4190 domain-containing protein [Streptomyces sp. NBC_01257]WSU61674.1 DUF4190 domain-containing protein [Streptomyces sp. NBC_01104]